MIQDADLEYEPQDYVPMAKALLSKQARCGVRKPLHEGLFRQLNIRSNPGRPTSAGGA
jgi:hypothetical protein